MLTIYTRTGDGGQTSLRGGTRIDKTDIRIETNAQLDFLNSILGLIRSLVPQGSEEFRMLYAIQAELMAIMSHVATPEGRVNRRPLTSADLVQDMEDIIDDAEKVGGFVLPGANVLSSLAHIARTQARITEIALWKLHKTYPVKEEIMSFMNRLSDYLFVMATEVSE